MRNEWVKAVGIATSVLRECKAFIPPAVLVESSKSHIKGFVEGEGSLIQCQMGLQEKKKQGVYIPCVKPIVARTTATVDRLKRMFFEDVKVIGLQVGVRKKRGGGKAHLYVGWGIFICECRSSTEWIDTCTSQRRRFRSLYPERR